MSIFQAMIIGFQALQTKIHIAMTAQIGANKDDKKERQVVPYS